MALAFFDVKRGLSIDKNVEIIATSGPPVSGDADAAGIGALAIDFVNGNLYQKGSAGSGPEVWQFIGADSNWREEVEVRENIATVLPTFTPATDATVDGETIVDQERVLFSALTVNPNIHIYDRSAGVFINDTNEETVGDTTFVVRGTDAGKKYVFNGTTWVQNDQAADDELGFIRDFIGKTGTGAETPTYSSTNIVTQSTNLENAVGELDAAMASSLTATELTGVSGTNTLDSVLVDDVASAKWLVTVRQGADVNSSIVHAVHDGVEGGADATDSDFTKFGEVNVGSTPSGFDIIIDLSGAGAAQVMRLRVTTTASADWKAVRIPVIF